MLNPSDRHDPPDLAEDGIHPKMPQFVATEAEFRSAVEAGLSDIAAGRTVAFKDVAHRLRKGRTAA